MELTKEQIERQDYVDGTIHDLIRNLSNVEIEWDIENIGKIRDAFKFIIVDDLELMTEQEFYPFLEDKNA
jgi:hypothetical protein